MKRRLAWLFLCVAPLAAQQRARNVILFLGDAAGIPTLHAASVVEYQEPGRLFIQQMPHIALMDTSTASSWVTDSAAGMTAIVTGYKTHNGVISQSDAAVRGQRDGAPLKTVLEYAEERGWATGVVSNSSVASATPAACYAHANDRNKIGEIFVQVVRPRFGDGIDVIIGPGRREIIEETRKLGVDIVAELGRTGPRLYGSVDAIPEGASRAAVLLEEDDFDLTQATLAAIDVLSRNPKGYFLMVESDCHTEALLRGLRRVIALDNALRAAVRRVNTGDTLILFTADHSYDFRIHDGDRERPLFGEIADPEFGAGVDGLHLENVRRDDDHTAEEVLVAAQGPGAERVRGFLPNTGIFHIMMAAFGWQPAAPGGGER